MKKILLVLCFVLLLIPVKVKADGTSNYFVDVTVNEDGSATFKEFIIFDGEFNYLERELYFRGNSKVFTGNTKDDFIGTNIYNASGITNICTYGLNKSYGENFSFSNTTNSCFTEVNYAEKGQSGLVIKNIDDSGANIRIYNHSSKNEAFYLEYTILDAVVIHNDIAEFLYNFEWTENIDNYKARINFNNDSEELRIFSHGPLNGENNITNRREVQASWKPLSGNTETDIRVVFDKSLVPNGRKYSYVNGLDKILEYEEEMANKQNKLREQARMKMIIYYVFFAIWVIVLGILLFNFYRKHDKEYKRDFKEKYFRDFPKDYGPEIVGYLFTKNNIKSEYLSASILELIRKKVLKLEVNQSNKKNFTILKNDETLPMTSSEKLLFSWFINELGNGEKVTNNDIKNASKNNYTSFLTSYKSWKDDVIASGESLGLYEEKGGSKFLLILFAFLGLIFFIVGINLGLSVLPIISFVIIIFSFIYLLSSTKRSKVGNEDYAKWKALKNFMLDFGRMSEKELPELILWDKYLVYATTFGIADKVQKAMEMKIKELNISDDNISTTTFLYGYHLGSFNSIGNTINKSISSAISTASAASSNSSSGSGFGGGASFGGGGGGFGGGGGRG